MKDTTLVVIGLIIVSLIVVAGLYFYQKSKNESDELNKQKLAIIQASLGGTVGQGYQQSGIGGWFTNLLNSNTASQLTPFIGKALIS
ncbi:MAG TPA: hypothetical protein PKD00_08440 [Burkholderiales bacterium]|nr:hypothetical protein [Burkholderiales bacterium]